MQRPTQHPFRGPEKVAATALALWLSMGLPAWAAAPKEYLAQAGAADGGAGLGLGAPIAPVNLPPATSAVPGSEAAPAATEVAPQAEQLQGSRARAAMSDAPLEKLGVFGTNEWGGRGVRRTVSAFGMPTLSVGLGVGVNFFASRGLFVSGDSSTLSGQTFSLSFAPIHGLELAVVDRSLAFQYRNAEVPRNLMLQGNPSFQVKYGHVVAGPLALGARVNVNAPARASGSGLNFGSLALQAEGLVSIQFAEWLEWTANVGYIYDRGHTQYDTSGTDAVQRFVYGINLVDRLSWATSAQTRFGAGHHVDISPFAEVSGEAGFKNGASSRTNPMLATVGARIMPRRSRAIELAVGIDARLTGSPAAGSPFGGLAPYQIFAQVSVHFRDAVRQVYNVHNEAGPQKPVVQDLFRVRGNVLDAQTGRPVAGVRLYGFDEEAALLTANPNDGHFVSWPVVREGEPLNLHAEAPSYLPASRQLTRPNTGDADLVWQLTPSDDDATLGTLRGVIKHAFTGRAVVGAKLTIATLGAPLEADKRGSFSVALRPGRYQATIEAPGFLPQEKLVEVESGETVELNVDLEPKG